ncbi:MAG: hypothetical protein E6H70_01480 [Betaproteobacteria bacterium]|nr:MAG: hypothetical protein E6H70_01480 [Betaproteobacteria bacterium]
MVNHRRPERPPTGRAQPAGAISPGLLKHRIIEARSLAMHCLIARKIEADRRSSLLRGAISPNGSRATATVCRARSASGARFSIARGRKSPR